MQYRINPRNGDKLSALGFGCMRFHKNGIEVEKQIRYAIEQGVNYFDTAYGYSGSEVTLGKILAKDGLRDKVKLATKMPQFMVKKYADFDRFFFTQLERLQTDHIDYYLMHMLPDAATWRRLVDMGVLRWVAEKRQSGAIRNLGFSFHGAQAEFIALLDAYDWDFCMIQYNYYDEFNQAGKTGLEYAGGKGLPVMVMEPLRGGMLVNKLPLAAKSVWDNAPKNRSPADWGIRWVLNHSQVVTVLSGMGSQEMVEENIRTASNAEARGLSANEIALYDKARTKMRELTKVGCTGCGYCMPCPQGVDIPMCFAALNDTVIKGRMGSMFMYLYTTRGHSSSLCTKCGKCESRCPQAIPIREKLSQTKRELEGFPYKPMKFIGKTFMNMK
jgi:predicted aldo/keto reductase-like oxidoreductase